MLRLSVLTAIVLASLTACGVSSQDDASAISKTGKYGSAEDLRKAAVKAGYNCPKWEKTKPSLAPGVGLSSSSGTCDKRDQFLVYSGKSSLADQLESWDHQFGEIPPAPHTLIGKNWIIQFDGNDDAKKLAKALDAKIED